MLLCAHQGMPVLFAGCLGRGGIVWPRTYVTEPCTQAPGVSRWALAPYNLSHVAAGELSLTPGAVPGLSCPMHLILGCYPFPVITITISYHHITEPEGGLGHTLGEEQIISY